MKGSCSVDNSMGVSIAARMQHISELRSGCWAIWPDINIVTGDDAETGCCYKVCSKPRTHSSLRGSVSFCSIRFVIATKFCGENRIHEISKT